MSAVTHTSQRTAAMPLAARVTVPAPACLPAGARLLGNGLIVDRPWDSGNSGFTAKQHSRDLRSSPT